MMDDLPFSEWKPISATYEAPNEVGLIHVRVTKDGKPFVIEGPKANDETGTVYIKACDDIQTFVRWLYAGRVNRKMTPLHPGAAAFHEVGGADLWPIEGIQVRYVTESQIKAAQVTLNIEYVAPEAHTPRYDELIRETLQITDSDSSGFWFPSSTRDIQFTMPSKTMAEKAIADLKAHPDLQDIKLTAEIKERQQE